MGLHYNRFRYYSQDMRMYISSDSIGLEANNPTLCGYVQDVTLNEQNRGCLLLLIYKNLNYYN